MLFLVLYIFCLVATVMAGFLSSRSDFQTMTIPNNMVFVIAIMFLAGFGVAYLAEVDVFEGILQHLVAASIVFIATFSLYMMKIIGGGDSKLASAFGLWVGLGNLMTFIFYWAVFGAVLGFIAIFIRKFKPFGDVLNGEDTGNDNGWLARLQRGESAVPYAIPITGGALIGMAMAGYFDAQLMAQFL